jgi:hypothetical protein
VWLSSPVYQHSLWLNTNVNACPEASSPEQKARITSRVCAKICDPLVVRESRNPQSVSPETLPRINIFLSSNQHEWVRAWSLQSWAADLIKPTCISLRFSFRAVSSTDYATSTMGFKTDAKWHGHTFQCTARHTSTAAVKLHNVFFSIKEPRFLTNILFLKI